MTDRRLDFILNEARKTKTLLEPDRAYLFFKRKIVGLRLTCEECSVAIIKLCEILENK